MGATSDAAQIKRDWARWPDANIGIATGPESGFWVVEADTLEGHDVDGVASLKQLEAEHGALPETLTAESPSGSQHRYFKWRAGVTIQNSASKIAPGVDVRGDGGMVIAPPSVKPGKGAYRWLNARTTSPTRRNG
jgi:putative DNA primase/helicase